MQQGGEWKTFILVAEDRTFVESNVKEDRTPSGRASPLPSSLCLSGINWYDHVWRVRHGSSSREMKDGITFPTLLTRDVAIGLLHGRPGTSFNILIESLRESHLICRCRKRLSQLRSKFELESESFFAICFNISGGICRTTAPPTPDGVPASALTFSWIGVYCL